MVKLSFVVLSTSLLLIGSCTAEELNEPPQNYNRALVGYFDTNSIIDDITIAQDGEGGSVAVGDVIVPSRVSGLSSQEKLLAVEERSLLFYTPEGFSKESKEWDFENCHFEVLEWRPYSTGQGQAYLANIESRCSEEDLIWRFMYSKQHGLQAMSYGVEPEDSEDTGNARVLLSGSLVLLASERGFGADFLTE